MRTKILLGLGAMVAILVGAATFAAYESHVVNITAHVEKATWVDPIELQFPTTFPEEVADMLCAGVPGTPTDPQNCAKIKLSDSFIAQSRVQDVTYKVYCELKDGYPGNYYLGKHLMISDSDAGDGNDEVVTALVGKPCPAGSEWATGRLDLSDTEDWWDFKFYVPLCEENYNAGTHVGPTNWDDDFPVLLPTGTCTLGTGSYAEVDLGMDLKFQIIGFSY